MGTKAPSGKWLSRGATRKPNLRKKPVLRVRAKTYFIQSYRVVKKSGVIYKSQKSVVFSKIDHINKGQGALNKLFKNGSVVINTTGSSRPELVLTNLPSFAEFYEELKKHY